VLFRGEFGRDHPTAEARSVGRDELETVRAVALRERDDADEVFPAQHPQVVFAEARGRVVREKRQAVEE